MGNLNQPPTRAANQAAEKRKQMILINRKNLAAVLPAVSKEESRYVVRGIHITEQVTEATNGHVAIRVTTPKVKASDFPAIAGFTPNGFTSCILPLEACKQVEKAIPNKEHIPILNNAAVSWDEQQQTVSLAVTDLDTPRVFSARNVTAQFPQLDKVFPKVEDESFSVTLSPELLSNLCTSAKKFGARSMKIHFYAADKAVYLTAKTNDEGQDWQSVIMPMRD